eukprot:5176633-Pyramimonas_sp.AAC.1
MRTPPVGPSVEPPRGPRNFVLGGKTHANTATRAFGGAPIWGHESLYWMGETHASTATWALRGAP